MGCKQEMIFRGHISAFMQDGDTAKVPSYKQNPPQLVSLLWVRQMGGGSGDAGMRGRSLMHEVKEVSATFKSLRIDQTLPIRHGAGL